MSSYSNALKIKEEEEVAELFSEVSGLKNYNLFLCNSGAEANENAVKIASFKTGRSKVLAFTGAFHGRTAGAIAVTDNPKIVAPFGEILNQTKIAFDDFTALENELITNAYAAVIIEGIQGVSGVFEASTEFWKKLKTLCTMTDTLLIADEIQSGCGRTGDFFAFQKHGIAPDLITMAKGIGNGFPVAGVLVNDELKAVKGELGTTFGGSYLACEAVKAVLQTIITEKLMQKAKELGEWISTELKCLPFVEEVRGRGLMIGIKTKFKAADLQLQLLEKGVITGNSTCPFTLRILPPLNIAKEELAVFLNEFSEVLSAPLMGAEVFER